MIKRYAWLDLRHSKISEQQWRALVEDIVPSGHLFVFRTRMDVATNGARNYEIPRVLQCALAIVWVDDEKPGINPPDLFHQKKQQGESCFILGYQRLPTRAKDIWTDRAIADVQYEVAQSSLPIKLMTRINTMLDNCPFYKDGYQSNHKGAFK